MSAEFERLKTEIEVLKKTVHDQKKIVKKQIKRNEELRNDAAAGITRLAERDAELVQKYDETRRLKDKCEKFESTIASLSSLLQCQICMDVLHKPFVLSPCGHVFCLLCLREWFRKAPMSGYGDPEYSHYLVHRRKSCPYCRATIVHRPIPLFLVKAATQVVTKAKAELDGATYCPDSPAIDGGDDPWRGIFTSSEEEELRDLSSELSSSYDSDYVNSLANYAAGVLTRFSHSSLNHELESISDSASESVGNVEDEEDEDSIGDHSNGEDTYVRPRWQPPSTLIGLSDLHNEDGDNLTLSQRCLLLRGCPWQMIQRFRMSYTDAEGIVAHVSHLNSMMLRENPTSDVDRMNRVFLGWNVDVDETVDRHGTTYMRRALEDLADHPERWEVRPRPHAHGAYDAIRLVRLIVAEGDHVGDSYLEDWHHEE
ncbi:hypothetical protein AMATHDRAFT_3411 [Amanita thiersii Skay4041]|uniref:RING-type domain-containing protein n=1 Tax=Amanita thiersii Skay4041 TaxID=703135 RepID=A0A2A9NLQ5_9AGAR|nr:hypothetical protein AMATHDRAFT_3411 [Amanita thiersii Skay4041]